MNNNIVISAVNSTVSSSKSTVKLLGLIIKRGECFCFWKKAMVQSSLVKKYRKIRMRKTINKWFRLDPINEPFQINFQYCTKRCIVSSDRQIHIILHEQDYDVRLFKNSVYFSFTWHNTQLLFGKMSSEVVTMYIVSS